MSGVKATLLLCEAGKRITLRSDKKQEFETLLHDVLVWLHKSGPAGNAQKTLQRCKWQADKDCNARRGQKHPLFPKLSQADEDPIRDLCRL